MLELPKNLIFLTTLRCPLECRHCIVDSNPKRGEAVPATLIYALIDEAAHLGVSTIGFTGGDPFIRPRELSQAVARAISLQMRVVIVTSAFWATSVEQAKRILLPFAGIYMLGLSTDSFHQEFTPIGHIRNAIQAAKEYGIPHIEIQVTYVDENECAMVQEALGSENSDIPVRGQRLWPVGRAAPLLLASEHSLVPIQSLDLTCPMGPPVVTPDLKLKGCCSSLLNLGDSNPIILGDLSKETLTAALRRATTHAYYLYIKTFGLGPLVEALGRVGLSGRLRSSYSDVCHLCYDIHSRKELREYLVHEIESAFNEPA